MTDFKHGSVKISNDIIDQLIAETALQVENVESVVGYKNSKVEKTKKDGIVSVITDNNMSVALTISVKDGVEIYPVCEAVQKSISEQVETMLGLSVSEVNVIVKNLV